MLMTRSQLMPDQTSEQRRVLKEVVVMDNTSPQAAKLRGSRRQKGKGDRPECSHAVD
jgi:hypothetical protein